MANLDDILKDSAPNIEIHNHMNYLYVLWKDNAKCNDTRNKPQILDLILNEYTDGIITWVDTYQINLSRRDSVVSETGYPDYHIKIPLKNTDYTIIAKTGIFWENMDGSNVWYSKEKKININNNNVRIARFKSQQYMIGELKDILHINNELKISLDKDEIENIDLVRYEFNWRQIKDNAIILPDQSLVNFVNLIFNDTDFEDIILNYEESTMVMISYLENKEVNIIIDNITSEKILGIL